MKLKTTLLLIGATAAPMFVNGAVQKGAMEVDFALSGSWMDAEVSSPAGSGSLDVDTLSLGASFGYFVTDAIETSVGLSYVNVDLDGIADIEAILGSVALDYHFNTQSTFVPYVGAALYYGDFEVDAPDLTGSMDDWAWEVRAGLKQFIRENVAIRYTVSYLQTSEMDIGIGDLEIDGFNIGIGLSVFF